jgi:hypothetical protein
MPYCAIGHKPSYSYQRCARVRAIPQVFAVVQTRLPNALADDLDEAVAVYEAELEQRPHAAPAFPAQELLRVMDAATQAGNLGCEGALTPRTR